MDLRQLRNLLAVMDEGTLGKAAARVNISQPALTKSIQRLETELGVRLFERNSRGMRPTLYADSLRGYAKAACLAMAEAQSQITALRNGTEGLLTVAAAPALAAEFLPKIVARLLSERPKLQVRVVSQNKELFSGLIEGRFNVVVAMLYDEAPDDVVDKHWIFNDELVVVMRPAHRLASDGAITAEKLAAEKWVLQEPSSWSHKRIRLYFEQNGLSLPRYAMESRDPAVLRGIIADSDHIGVMARLGIRRDIDAGRLTAIGVNSPLMRRPIGVALRKNEPISHSVRALMRIARELAAAEAANAGADPSAMRNLNTHS